MQPQGTSSLPTCRSDTLSNTQKHTLRTALVSENVFNMTKGSTSLTHTALCPLSRGSRAVAWVELEVLVLNHLGLEGTFDHAPLTL